MSNSKRQPVSYRPYRPADLPEILRIQDASLVTNLAPQARADGFLSVAFTPEQFAAMHREIPIVVADLGSGLGGYLCGSGLSSSQRVPLLATMIATFGETKYGHRPLDAYRSFVYGPVCIDRPHRGRGLLEGLFAEQMRHLKGRFDIGTLFVSDDNPRSLRAHTRHLKMSSVSRFTFSGKEFHLLVFTVPGDTP